MRLITGGAAHLGANHGAFSQPLFRFVNGIGVVHAFVQHGQLNGGDGFARYGAQPINACGHMSCQLRQFAAPLGVFGQCLNDGVARELGVSFPYQLAVAALKLQEVALQLI